MATPTQRLGDILLGGDGQLEAYVRAARSEGKAWRTIAADLDDQGLEVTGEALRQWYPDRDGDAA